MFWFSILQICQKFRYCSRLHKKVELTCDATHPNKKNWRFMSAVFLLPPSGQKNPKSVIAPLKAWAHPQKCQGICPYCTRLQSEAIFRHNRWQVEQEDKISPLLSCHKIEGNIFTRAGSVIDNKYVRKPRDLHQQLQHLFQLHTTRVTCNATLISSSYGCTQRDKTRHKKTTSPPDIIRCSIIRSWSGIKEWQDDASGCFGCIIAPFEKNNLFVCESDILLICWLTSTFDIWLVNSPQCDSSDGLFRRLPGNQAVGGAYRDKKVEDGEAKPTFNYHFRYVLRRTFASTGSCSLDEDV